MFEQNNETTSPPSRGRSPAGSVTSDSSRPYSKVRTSFISVDRSGQLGSTPREMSNNDSAVGGDGSSEPKATPGGSDAGISKVNGNSTHANPMRPTSSGLDAADADGTEEGSQGPNGVEKENPTVDVPAENPDKPVTGAQEDPVEMLPADPKEETAVTEGAALKKDAADLGSVLKGSPFAKATGQPETNNESTKHSSPEKAASPKQTPRSREVAKVNGQPKELNNNIKSPRNAKPTTPASLPSTTRTKKDAKSTSDNVDVNSPTTPQTDGPTDSASTGPPARTSLERRSVQRKMPNGATDKAGKAPAQVPTSKAPQGEPTKPRQSSMRSTAGPNNKSGPTSPLHKPRPKSPTRPVRLPVSATAPTASSAAKLGGAPPSRSPSRASIASNHKPFNLNKARPTPLTSTTAQSRQKPVRSSLPPQSGTAEKPKTRTSTASARGTDGGFLARMMRPTESSRSKTHEKVEVKSPPRKTARPKRQSGGTEAQDNDKVKEAAKPANAEATEAPKQEDTKTSEEESKNEGPDGGSPQAADTEATPVEPVQ